MRQLAWLGVTSLQASAAVLAQCSAEQFVAWVCVSWDEKSTPTPTHAHPYTHIKDGPDTRGSERSPITGFIVVVFHVHTYRYV